MACTLREAITHQKLHCRVRGLLHIYWCEPYWYQSFSIFIFVQIFLIVMLTKECGSGSGLKQLCLQDLEKDLDTLLDKWGLGASRKGPHEDLGPQWGPKGRLCVVSCTVFEYMPSWVLCYCWWYDRVLFWRTRRSKINGTRHGKINGTRRGKIMIEQP